MPYVIDREATPKTAVVDQVIAGGGGVGLKEYHSHHSKDEGHSEEQDGDEHHGLEGVEGQCQLGYD